MYAHISIQRRTIVNTVSNQYALQKTFEQTSKVRIDNCSSSNTLFSLCIICMLIHRLYKFLFDSAGWRRSTTCYDIVSFLVFMYIFSSIFFRYFWYRFHVCLQRSMSNQKIRARLGSKARQMTYHIVVSVEDHAERDGFRSLYYTLMVNSPVYAVRWYAW